MKNKGVFLIFLALLFPACGDYYYKIKLKNPDEIKQAILITENLMKKVEMLPAYKSRYPSFWISDDKINISYTILNYNSNDSIQEGRPNPNSQYNIDTCLVMPGLTNNEWIILKNSLAILKKAGITNSRSAFHCDKTDSYFFYYGYYFSDSWDGFTSVGYLAVLPDSIINSCCFKSNYKITDEKDGLYMIRRIP